MIVLKIIFAIMLIIFTLLIYSCIKISSDCSREEEANERKAD